MSESVKRIWRHVSSIGFLAVFLIYGCGSGGGVVGPIAFAIAAGNGTSCVLLPNNRQIECWGVIPGTPSSVSSSASPTGVSGLTTATAISISDASGHICVVIAGGTVQCWGNNTDGQLGNGTTTTSPALYSPPVPVTGISTAIAISAGGSHSCALLQSGAVQCWGLNTNGQLGNGTGPQGPQGIAVDASGNVWVANYGNSSVTEIPKGAASCSPASNCPSFTFTSTTSSSTPVAVSGITTATAISARGNSTCAILGAGTVQCWGANLNGQLGNATTKDSSTPVAVAGITTATAVSVGSEHACAILSGGTLQCWGLNNFGQLGNGTTTSSSSPVDVSGITTAIAVSAGANHTCALLINTTVQCWGLNNTGQLGNGTNTNSSIPSPVYFQLIGVIAISVGVDQSCALLSGGPVECWGLNTYGQVGNGTTTDSLIPVVVNGA